MSTVKRFNKIKLDQGLKVDANGFLRAHARATRVGIFKYRGPNGEIIKEFRPPDQVFDQESMASLSMVPVTLEHPEEGFVTPKNADRLQVGSTGMAVNAEPFLETSVVVTRENAIQAIQDGKQELSCGYTCELDWTAGSWNGEDYDAVQKNIRYNHLAIVGRGRAGPQVRLKLDSGDAEEIDGEGDETQEEKMKVKIGDKEYDVSDEAGKAFTDALASKDGEIGKLKADLSASEEEKKANATKADKAEARADTLEDKLKSASGAKESEAEIQKRVDARLAVIKVAERVTLAKDFKIDSASDLEIKKAILASHRPNLKLDDKTADYVSMAYDFAAEEILSAESGRVSIGSQILKGRKDSEEEIPSAKEARRKMITDSENGWTKPLANTSV